MSTSLKDLFRWYAIPPSPLHAALQQAAREAGWTPPWDREEQHEEQQSKKKKAGERSGLKRMGRAEVRRHFVKISFERLKPAYRMQPFSESSMTALKAAYRSLLAEGHPDPDWLMLAAPFKADHETLIKDLKLLGIRSRHRAQRSR